MRRHRLNIAAPLLRLGLTGALACTVLAAASAQAQTWPDYQASLLPGRSTSPNKAFVGRDAVPAAPAAKDSLIGLWDGWIGRGRAGSVELSIISLSDTSARVVYAYADREIVNSTDNTQCAVRSVGLLQCPIDSDGHPNLTIRSRADGNLDILYARGSRDWTGVLSRAR